MVTTALFDLNKTLIKVPHVEFMREHHPAILEAYLEDASVHVAYDYEYTLTRGLYAGNLPVEALPGVADKLAEMQADGFYNAVYSTCLNAFTGKALDVAGFERGLIQAFFSTWDYQFNPNRHKKTSGGFHEVRRTLPGGNLAFFADDKPSALEEARILGVDRYCVGNDAPGATRVASIADINHRQYLQ